MRTGLRLLLIYFLILFTCGTCVIAGDNKTITNFSLKSSDGSLVSLGDYPSAKGFIVVFTCNHCPFAKLYPQRFNQLNSKYLPQGVPLLAINSMDTLVYDDESLEKMKSKATEDGFNFPYLQDSEQSVGKLFGAEHTPQAFIIWKVEGIWKVKYCGAIDDNGEHPELAIPYVANTVDELLHGKPVSMPQTPSFGCRIFYRNSRD